MPLARLLLGRILPNRRSEERKLTAVTGVPALGLDGLGSSAYGPEAALLVLLPLGAAGLAHALAILIAIVVLLAILYASYWQTVRAYPENGGAYVVARENLGRGASLVAAVALMIDYVLKWPSASPPGSARSSPPCRRCTSTRSPCASRSSR